MYYDQLQLTTLLGQLDPVSYTLFWLYKSTIAWLCSYFPYVSWQNTNEYLVNTIENHPVLYQNCV